MQISRFYDWVGGPVAGGRGPFGGGGRGISAEMFRTTRSSLPHRYLVDL